MGDWTLTCLGIVLGIVLGIINGIALFNFGLVIGLVLLVFGAALITTRKCAPIWFECENLHCSCMVTDMLFAWETFMFR